MQRPKLRRHDKIHRSTEQMSILTAYENFTFSIIPCDLHVAREMIRRQGAQWENIFEIDEDVHRDVRIIYDSPDGPKRYPSINVGILLSEVDGNDGKKTLFVSSVTDGYSSMIFCISKLIPGAHFKFDVSRPDLLYPGNAIRVLEDGKNVRTVYSMRDGERWVFFENGHPFPFEETDLCLARRKRDRLTPEIISTYLERIGYGSLKREFWINATAPARLLAMSSFRFCRPDDNINT
ncbi:hypothetical protein [Methylosinus trichosporium]|uniref:hypothetical protein n=1 Tax=Methylosinus trichosporium TaxID=426 RepID=UPI0024B8B38F|nr:hypothetical protein [Methylosinus trichosporium]